MKGHGSPFVGKRVYYVPDTILSDVLSAPFVIAQNHPEGFVPGVPAGGHPFKGTKAGISTIQDVAFMVGLGFILETKPTIRAAQKGTTEIISGSVSKLLGPQNYRTVLYEDE